MDRLTRSVRCASNPLSFLLVLLAPLVWPRVIHADPAPEAVVYPTGVFPDDVKNVQAAVALGGTVRLSDLDLSGRPAAFNFGPPDGFGHVFLRKDVALLGSDDEGGPMTTINGGTDPVIVSRHVQTTIARLRFVSPGDTAIVVYRSAGAVIEGNMVTNVVSLVSRFGLTFAWGIVVEGFPGFDGTTGNVRIADNVIDGVQAAASYGILSCCHDATATIEHNTIRNIGLNGILVGNISQPAWISDNDIAPGNEADSFGNGIFVGHFRGAHVVIRGNRVTAVNPGADGIGFIGGQSSGAPLLPVDGSLVEHNAVTMHNSLYGGISLYDAVSHVVVTQNRVDGDGAEALQIGNSGDTTEFQPGTAIGNTFSENHVEDFQAGVADISLDVNAAQTLLCHQPGTVNDNSTALQVERHCPGGDDPAFVSSGGTVVRPWSGAAQNMKRRIETLSSIPIPSMSATTLDPP